LSERYKILAISDAAFNNTGYGNQSNVILSRLVKRGWEVYQLPGNSYTLQSCEPGEEYPIYKGIKIIPNTEIDRLGINGLYGTKESIWEIYNKIKPDIVWTMNDFHRVAGLSEFNDEFIDKWVHWLPIDTNCKPDGWVGDSTHFMNRLKFVIFMSNFGWETSAKYLPHVMYKDAVYLGVPSDVFKPLYSKTDMKKVTGFADKFVIITVARHQPRKMVWKTVNVVTKFLKNHPDAVWYCKTTPNDPAMEEYTQCEKDLSYLVNREGVNDRVAFEPRHFSPEQMNEFYNTGDVFIHLSGGEGFGIPYVESMMAGTPCILSNNTTSPELTNNWEFGLPVKIKESILLMAYGSTYDLADEDDAIRQLEFAYNDWKNDNSKWLKEAGKKAREFHKQWCDIEKIVSIWEDIFHKMIQYNDSTRNDRMFDENYFTNINKYNPEYHEGWANRIISEMSGLTGSILEIGCGRGYLMKHLLAKGKNVAGVDISDWAVEHPMPGCENRIFKGNILNLPYDDKTFDAVIAFSVLEHIPEKDAIQALKEIKRVAKKAFLLIAMPILGEGHKEILEQEDPTHINIKPLTWWQDKLKEVGLRVIMQDRMEFIVEPMEGLKCLKVGY